jgi:hypothetical protein
MRLEVTTPPLGAMAKVADAESKLFRRCQWRAVKAEGDKIKTVGRNAVRKAKIRGASRLATAIRGTIFPKDQNALARSPAYVIGSNAEIPLANLETGAVIAAKGKALMIPIGEAARFKQPNFAEQAGRLARTIAAMRAKYGKLSWRKLRGGTLAYGAWAPTRSAGQLRFKALFILRKSVTIPKKHDAEAQMARAGRGFDQRVAEATMRMFAAEHDAVVTRAAGSLAR